MQIVLIVHRTLSLWLVVSRTPRVSVTLDTQGKMEECVHGAIRTNTPMFVKKLFCRVWLLALFRAVAAVVARRNRPV